MLPMLFHSTLNPSFEQLDTIFNTLWEKNQSQSQSVQGGCAPTTSTSDDVSMDIYEHEDRYELWLDVPGLARNEIKLSVEDNTLVVKGERPALAQDANERLFRRVERWTGAFSRSIELPQTVDTTRIQANLKDGVLKLVLAKREQAKARQIDIQV